MTPALDGVSPVDRLVPADPPHRPVRRFPIRTGLVTLVLLCIVPAIVLVTALVAENYRLREAAIYDETLLRARGIMVAVDRELARIESSLIALGASHRLDAADLTSFDRRLRQTPRSSLVGNYHLVDRNGRQILNTLVPYGTALPAPRAWSEMRQVFESAQPVATNLFVNRVSEEHMIALSVPVTRNGEVIYALGVGISSSALSDILAQQHVPDGWVAAIMDGNGVVVARMRDAKRFVGRRAVASLVERGLSSLEGVLETTTLDGDTVLTAVSHSETSNLWIAVGAPQSSLTHDLTRSVVTLVAAVLLLFAIGLVFAFRLARSLSRSVSGLIEPALALGSQRPVDPPPTSLAEAHAVGRALVEASRMMAHARHQAYHDALTGLCNRALFDELAMHQVAAVRRTGKSLAIVAIDLDGFKAVNDRLGHAVGDAVLKEAALRIGQAIRGSDVVSRRGGDEFTVLLDDVDAEGAGAIVAKLATRLADPYADVPIAVSASLGVAVFPVSGDTLDALLERADRALYAAKQAGRKRFVMDE